MVIGLWQIVIIALLVLLLFGASRLGEIGKGLGEGIRAFRRGMSDAPPRKGSRRDDDDDEDEDEKKDEDEADDDDRESARASTKRRAKPRLEAKLDAPDEVWQRHRVPVRAKKKRDADDDDADDDEDDGKRS